MSVKIFDTMTTATPNFPLAYAEKINIVKEDGSEDNLQNLFNNGELGGLGGGGTSYIELSEEEYFALSDEQRASEVEYRTYDTGRIFKRGVEYGKDGVLIDDETASTDTVWSSKKTSDEIADIESALDELENITRLTDFDEAIPEKGKNKIYYVNKLIGTYKCAQWRVESMYYDVSGIEQYRGVQKATSINGVDNIMLMREYYLENNVMHWSDWTELATMDKFTNYTKNIKIGETEDVDANNLKSNANYIFPEGYEGNVSNMPSWVKRGGGFIECKSWGNYVTQVFYPYAESTVYIRSLYYYDNKLQWINWKELATMDKVNALHKETTGFITGSLLGSVVKDANLYYQKFGDNRLVVNGWVSVDAVSARTPIFTLPNNWKANSNYLLPCYVIDSNVACACVIDIEKGTVNSYTPLPATLELRFCGEIYLM